MDFSRETTRIMAVLSEVTKKVQNTSATLTNVADAASNEASNAQSASNNASQNVQTVASATEQLASSIKEISRQSLDVSDVIEKSSNDVEHIDQNVNELSASAQKIGDVIGIIREIAEQTNLLALNAQLKPQELEKRALGLRLLLKKSRHSPIRPPRRPRKLPHRSAPYNLPHCPLPKILAASMKQWVKSKL